MNEEERNALLDITRRAERNEIIELLYVYCEANHSAKVCPPCEARISFISDKRREANGY